MEVVLDGIQVMYVSADDNSKSIQEAFKKLEDAILWKLRGRRFYGTMFNGEYRACLEIIDPTEPEKLKFPTWTIPAGKYFKDKINNWTKHIKEIAPRTKEIISKVNYDSSRGTIEFYRDQRTLYLFIPIR